MNLGELSIPFIGNGIDLLFILLIIFFIFTNNGVVNSTIELIGLFFSFIFSFTVYPFTATLIVKIFSLNKAFSNAIGFIVTWFVAEIIFFILARVISKKIPNHIYSNKWNYILGFIPGFIYGVIFYTFIVTLIIALPVRGELKKVVLDSNTAPSLVSYSSQFEGLFRNIFNDAIAESLNFLTIKQNSSESVDLGFKLSEQDLSIDREAEHGMIDLVNHERTSRGLPALIFDENMTTLARNYGKEMFIYGFFSHQSEVDNSTPAERMDKANIDYLIMGENLAYAPTLQIAHTGLMNSEGHRKNILSPEFGKIGIGVIDGGIYGKIFVQEFKD